MGKPFNKYDNRVPLEVRFWSRVKKTKGCWIWNPCLVAPVKGRYGSIGVNGIRTYTHRVSWELHFGKIPKGIRVLHKCDNPSCVRPDHLFLGTQLDNLLDCIAKGRHNPKGRANPGERNGGAKLTWADVTLLRKMANKGAKISTLIRRFDICDRQILNILQNKSWKI